jgi:hypothetical protein
MKNDLQSETGKSIRHRNLPVSSSFTLECTVGPMDAETHPPKSACLRLKNGPCSSVSISLPGYGREA